MTAMHRLRRTLNQLRVASHVHVVMLVAWISLTAQKLADGRLILDDEGSETTEWAVRTAIGLGLALGLGAAITALTHKYQAQLH